MNAAERSSREEHNLGKEKRTADSVQSARGPVSDRGGCAKPRKLPEQGTNEKKY